MSGRSRPPQRKTDRRRVRPVCRAQGARIPLQGSGAYAILMPTHRAWQTRFVVRIAISRERFVTLTCVRCVGA
jgi:hypothetical protein